MISIIIPVYNESEGIAHVLTHTLRVVGAALGAAEIIVVDGGSTDRTKEIVQGFTRVRLVVDTKGRGRQMNAGAHAAKGEVLLFLHGDCVLPVDGVDLVEEKMQNSLVVGGGFCKKYVEKSPKLWVNLTVSYLRVEFTRRFYGNDAIFVRGKVFEKMKGFQEWPFLEDVDFSTRLREKGKVVLIRKCVQVSARRYLKHGVMRQMWRNMRILWGYYRGEDIENLRKKY